MTTSERNHNPIQLQQALSLSGRIVDAIMPYCYRAEVAGDVRRSRPMIDQLVMTVQPIVISDLFGEIREEEPTMLDRYFEGKAVPMLVDTPRLKRFQYGPLPVDMHINFTSRTWGVSRFIHTGPSAFVQWAFSQANGRIEERGNILYVAGSETVIETTTEAAVFRALDLPYVPSTARDDAPHDRDAIIAQWGKPNQDKRYSCQRCYMAGDTICTHVHERTGEPR